jgi:hypothetical protein
MSENGMMSKVIVFGYITSEKILQGDISEIISSKEYARAIQEQKISESIESYILSKFQFVNDSETGTSLEAHKKLFFTKSVESLTKLVFSDCAIMMDKSHFFDSNHDNFGEFKIPQKEFINKLEWFLCLNEAYTFHDFLIIFGNGVIYSNYNQSAFLANCLQNKLLMKIIVDMRLKYAEFTELFVSCLERKLPTSTVTFTRFKKLTKANQFKEASSLMINNSK